MENIPSGEDFKNNSSKLLLIPSLLLVSSLLEKQPWALGSDLDLSSIIHYVAVHSWAVTLHLWASGSFPGRGVSILTFKVDRRIKCLQHSAWQGLS